MNRMTITLSKEEREALWKLSESEMRHPRKQAMLLIRRELERLGLIAPKALQAESEAAHTKGSEQ